MFRKIHLFNRFFCSILLLLTILMVNDFYALWGIHLFLLILFFLEDNNRSLDFVILSFVLTFFSGYYTFLNFFCKILLLGGVISNFYVLLRKNEIRMFLEKIFYPFHSISSIIRHMYYKKIYSYHQKQFGKLKDFLTPKGKYKNYIENQIKRKTEEDLKRREDLCYFRFYGTFRKRSNVVSLSKWDLKDFL